MPPDSQTLPYPATSARPPDAGFELLFRTHYPAVVRSAMRVLGDRGRAEDIAAEAFIRLMRETGTVDHPAGWLTRCALHLAIDLLRSLHRRQRREQAYPFPDPSNPEQDLAAAQQQRQQQAQVRAILAALPTRDAVLLLARAEGSSYQELAAMLDLNPRSIGTTLARAEKRFQEEYENRYGKQ